jgi:hypothetical protein
MEIVNVIKAKFNFNTMFEKGDVDEILDNCAQREMPEVVATRVYILNKHVQKILYSGSNAFFTFHIVQAGCGCFEKHTGIVNKEILNYRVEGPMNFLLKQTKFVINVSLDLFLKVL